MMLYCCCAVVLLPCYYGVALLWSCCGAVVMPCSYITALPLPSCCPIADLLWCCPAAAVQLCCRPAHSDGGRSLSTPDPSHVLAAHVHQVSRVHHVSRPEPPVPERGQEGRRRREPGAGAGPTPQLQQRVRAARAMRPPHPRACRESARGDWHASPAPARMPRASQPRGQPPARPPAQPQRRQQQSSICTAQSAVQHRC